jgi:hypothetical protein
MFSLLFHVNREDRKAETPEITGIWGLTYPGDRPILRIARAKEHKPNVILHH